MLTAFPLSEIEHVVRRTVIAAIVAGALAAAAAVLLGQPLFAPGLAIGLALGIANHRAFQSSALRFTTPEGVINRRPFAGSVALRLGVCTAVAVGLLVVERPMGWGAVAGLAIFQFMLLANALIRLVGYQKQPAGDAGGGDA